MVVGFESAEPILVFLDVVHVTTGLQVVDHGQLVFAVVAFICYPTSMVHSSV